MDKKLIEKYEVFCTGDQTVKAFELGADLRYIKACEAAECRAMAAIAGGRHGDEYTLVDNFQQPGDYWCMLINNPTADQMVGWLESQGFYFNIGTKGASCEIDCTCIYEDHEKPRVEAVLLAVGAALDYLMELQGKKVEICG